MSKIKEIKFIKGFQCIGSECKNHCCQTWKVAVDDNTINKYSVEAPELLDSIKNIINQDGSEENIYKRDENRVCSMIDLDGLCKIHKKYGPEFLSDICFSFPRSFKKIGNDFFRVTNIGCPESCRMALYGESFDFVDIDTKKDYHLERANLDMLSGVNSYNLQSEEVLKIFHSILDVVGKASSADCAINTLRNIFYQFNDSPSDTWLDILYNTKEEIFDETFVEENLQYKALLQMYYIKRDQFDKPRLNMVLDKMSRIMGIGEIANNNADFSKIDEIIQSVASKYDKISKSWHEKYKKNMDLVLKNYIKAKLSESIFPFGRNVRNFFEEMMIFVVQYIVVRIGIMCYCFDKNDTLDEEETVEVVQTFERTFYGTNSNIFIKKFSDFGWNKKDNLTCGLFFY